MYSNSVQTHCKVHFACYRPFTLPGQYTPGSELTRVRIDPYSQNWPVFRFRGGLTRSWVRLTRKVVSKWGFNLNSAPVWPISCAIWTQISSHTDTKVNLSVKRTRYNWYSRVCHDQVFCRSPNLSSGVWVRYPAMTLVPLSKALNYSCFVKIKER